VGAETLEPGNLIDRIHSQVEAIHLVADVRATQRCPTEIDQNPPTSKKSLRSILRTLAVIPVEYS
jgi:hypothetical protein